MEGDFGGVRDGGVVVFEVGEEEGGDGGGVRGGEVEDREVGAGGKEGLRHCVSEAEGVSLRVQQEEGRAYPRAPPVIRAVFPSSEKEESVIGA